ncbi:Uncharacterised protein [Mycobacteroides abscessus subsp. abscessus]|nr:Uncharacterised protein [Mycobacteroides abscessus subsp. abscessus]
MMKRQDIVPVSLQQIDFMSKDYESKTPQKPKLACRIKDVNNNRDIHVYNGIDKYILYTILKEL